MITKTFTQSGYPSIGYEQIESPDVQQHLDNAFDILFDLVLEKRKKLYEPNKINSNIR
jgi:hypothetical protein